MARKSRGSHTRPIRSKRDYAGAANVVKRLSGQMARTADAEARLQSLLKELDRFDDVEEEEGGDAPEDYSAPRRRWSDDGAE